MIKTIGKFILSVIILSVLIFVIMVDYQIIKNPNNIDNMTLLQGSFFGFLNIGFLILYLKRILNISNTFAVFPIILRFGIGNTLAILSIVTLFLGQFDLFFVFTVAFLISQGKLLSSIKATTGKVSNTIKKEKDYIINGASSNYVPKAKSERQPKDKSVSNKYSYEDTEIIKEKVELEPRVIKDGKYRLIKYGRGEMNHIPLSKKGYGFKSKSDAYIRGKKEYGTSEKWWIVKDGWPNETVYESWK